MPKRLIEMTNVMTGAVKYITRAGLSKLCGREEAKECLIIGMMGDWCLCKIDELPKGAVITTV